MAVVPASLTRCDLADAHSFRAASANFGGSHGCVPSDPSFLLRQGGVMTSSSEDEGLSLSVTSWLASMPVANLRPLLGTSPPDARANAASSSCENDELSLSVSSWLASPSSATTLSPLLGSSPPHTPLEDGSWAGSRGGEKRPASEDVHKPAKPRQRFAPGRCSCAKTGKDVTSPFDQAPARSLNTHARDVMLEVIEEVIEEVVIELIATQGATWLLDAVVDIHGATAVLRRFFEGTFSTSPAQR